MVQFIIFDLDGVIIDSESQMRYAFERTYRDHFPYGPVPIEEYLSNLGMSFPKIMRKLDLPVSLWESYRSYCISTPHLVTVFPGIVDLLGSLRERGIIMAVLTGKDQVRAARILRNFDLEKYFKLIVGSDTLSQGKPSPEGIHLILKSLGGNNENTVLVGDSVSDINAAKNADIRSIAVTWGIKPDLVLKNSAPNYIANSINELNNLIKQLNADSSIVQ